MFSIGQAASMGRAVRTGTLVLVLAATIGLAGCASQGAGQPGAEGGQAGGAGSAEAIELQVFAANSLSKAVEEVQALYTSQNPHITFADAQSKGSGELNQMLAGGAYADVLISASEGSMDAAAEAGSIDEATRLTLFANDLVIVAQTGSGKGQVTLEDIAAGRFSVAVGDESVPAGNYACQALSTVGAYVDPSGATGADITGKGGAFQGITPILQSSAGNVCKQAENGDVDVALVYSSDVYRFGGVEVVGTVPAETHRDILYPGAVTSCSKHAEAAAAFLSWCVTDPEAQRIWNAWGFEIAG